MGEISEEIKGLVELDKGMNLVMEIVKKMAKVNKIVDEFESKIRRRMDIIDGKPHSYLGDGVYGIFDGFGIWLHANDHRAEFATDKIYLEPSVFVALERFYKMVKEPK